MAQAFSEKNAP